MKHYVMYVSGVPLADTACRPERFRTLTLRIE
jgi:hypothetical protein